MYRTTVTIILIIVMIAVVGFAITLQAPAREHPADGHAHPPAENNEPQSRATTTASSTLPEK